MTNDPKNHPRPAYPPRAQALGEGDSARARAQGDSVGITDMQALIKNLTSPFPGRIVDMNDFRADVETLRWALEQFFECLSSTPIKLNPRTGEPCDEEIDRVADVLLAFGIKNARIEWDKANRAWVLG